MSPVDWISSHWETLFSGIGISLGAFFRDQLKAFLGRLWAVRKETSESDTFNVIRVEMNVRIEDFDGKRAVLEKHTKYTVLKDTSELREGVGVSGTATDFRASTGLIKKTENDRGFYSSLIDLGNIMRKGTVFSNVYTALLHDTFTSEEENWGQETPYKTQELVVRVQFPKDRPPKLLKCRISSGSEERQVPTQIKSFESDHGITAEWLIEKPRRFHCYSIVWMW